MQDEKDLEMCYTIMQIHSILLNHTLQNDQDVVGGVDTWSQKHTQKEDSVSNTGEGSVDRPRRHSQQEEILDSCLQTAKQYISVI